MSNYHCQTVLKARAHTEPTMTKDWEQYGVSVLRVRVKTKFIIMGMGMLWCLHIFSQWQKKNIPYGTYFE